MTISFSVHVTVEGIRYYIEWELENLQPVAHNGTTVFNHFYAGGDDYLMVGRFQSDDGSYETEVMILKYNKDDRVFEDTGKFEFAVKLAQSIRLSLLAREVTSLSPNALVKIECAWNSLGQGTHC